MELHVGAAYTKEQVLNLIKIEKQDNGAILFTYRGSQKEILCTAKYLETTKVF